MGYENLDWYEWQNRRARRGCAGKKKILIKKLRFLDSILTHYIIQEVCANEFVEETAKTRAEIQQTNDELRKVCIV